MEKTYYITFLAERIDLSDPAKEPERHELRRFEISGEESEVIPKEKERFYKAGEKSTRMEVEDGWVEEDEEFDVLFMEIVYSDPEYTNEVTRFWYSQNEIVRNIVADLNGVNQLVGNDRCNTITAQRIGECVYKSPGMKVVYQTKKVYISEGTDADWIRERLYRKRTGHFFIETAYQKNSHMVWEDFTYRWIGVIEARKWVRDHDPEAYEDLFGEIEENSETVAISANIRGDTQKKLDRMKALLGLTTGEMIDQLVADYEREAQ